MDDLFTFLDDWIMLLSGHSLSDLLEFLNVVITLGKN